MATTGGGCYNQPGLLHMSETGVFSAMRKATVRLLALIMGIVALTLAACGAGNSASGRATQTPQYVVVTDTPEGPGASGQSTNGTSSADSEIVAAPTPFLCKAEVIEQTYEHGYMFWVGATTDERCKTDHNFNPGDGEIWVAILDETGQVGKWLRFADEWDPDSDPEQDIFRIEIKLL